MCYYRICVLPGWSDRWRVLSSLGGTFFVLETYSFIVNFFMVGYNVAGWLLIWAGAGIVFVEVVSIKIYE